MHNWRELAARVLISFAAANLVLPLSLLFSGLGGYGAPAVASGATRAKRLPAKSFVRVDSSRMGKFRVAVVAPQCAKDVCGLMNRLAIGAKHRLHRDRAIETRTNDGRERLSPFANDAMSCVADAIFAVETSRHADHDRSTPDRCIDLSRLVI
jgi:hypothetical protein